MESSQQGDTLENIYLHIIQSMIHNIRYDIYSKAGLQPSRQSASTQAVSTSSSSNFGSLVRGGQTAGQAEYGQEQEVSRVITNEDNDDCCGRCSHYSLWTSTHSRWSIVTS